MISNLLERSSAVQSKTMQIQAQSGSFSVSEAKRTPTHSALGKRSIREMLATGDNQIIMPANESSERRIFPDEQILQAQTRQELLVAPPGNFINQKSDQASIPLGMSHHLLQPIQPRTWGAIEEADETLIQRLSSIVAVTQRHSLEKGKQPMSNQIYPRGLVLSKTPLVAGFLQQSSETERTAHSTSSYHNRTHTHANIFVKGDGPLLEARRRLLITKKPTAEVHDCRIMYEIDVEGSSFFTLATKKHVDVFFKQFSEMMNREGFYPQSDDFLELLEKRLKEFEDAPKCQHQDQQTSPYSTVQPSLENSGPDELSEWQAGRYDGIMWMTTNGPYAAGSSFQPCTSNNLPSNVDSLIPTQADLEFPWILTIAGNHTARVPILLPYSFRIEAVTVRGLGPFNLAGSYQLPPIPSDMVVPVQTPCIVTMRVAARLLTMARSESHSGKIMQLLPWILGNH